MLSAEKECSFFKFYSNDKTKDWDLANEDCTAYNIWREAFERSRSGHISTIVNEYGENQDILDENLVIEELNEWQSDPHAE